LQKPLGEVQMMGTAEKLSILMKHRKDELRKLISVYYRQRGWTEAGIPKVETLKQIGLWPYLSDEAKATITGMSG
jgi:aldehyde:ferredoxin oxidoreductase